MEINENFRNDIKGTLLKNINEIPGIRYRELLRLTGISNGVLTYHLDLLNKSNLIKVYRRSRMTRYYPMSILTEEFDVIGFMRQHTARQIITLLLEHELCTFNEIVEYTKKAPSTISWHFKRLRDAGLISIQYGEGHLYRLVDSNTVREILSKYKESFTDKVVDNYIEMTDDL